MTFNTISTVKLCQSIIVMTSQRDNTMRHDNALPVSCHSRYENWTSIHSFVPCDIATLMRHNNYLRLAIVRRSAARDVEQWGRRYNIAIMSDVNCNVSDKTLQYCKEFLEKYPEAPNWNKTRIILPLTRITSFHVYVLERYDISMVRCIAYRDSCYISQRCASHRTMHMSYRSKTYTWNDVILVKRSMIRVFKVFIYSSGQYEEQLTIYMVTDVKAGYSDAFTNRRNFFKPIGHRQWYTSQWHELIFLAFIHCRIL